MTGDNGSKVTLREYVDKLITGAENDIRHERELREQALKTIEDTFTIEKEAQKLRDEKLNDVRTRFVPREVWEAFEKTIERRLDYFNRLAIGLLLTVIGLMAAGILNLIISK